MVTVNYFVEPYLISIQSIYVFVRYDYATIFWVFVRQCIDDNTFTLISFDPEINCFFYSHVCTPLIPVIFITIVVGGIVRCAMDLKDR